MPEDLPFNITPQIKRYLEELTLCDECDFSGNEKSSVETFSNGELLSDDSFANIERFLGYLKNSELVKIDEFPKIVKTGKIKRIYPNTLKITVFDQKSLQVLADFINKKTITQLNKNEKRLISMDGEGDFTIGKHKDLIPFKSKKAGYYKVFVAIYKSTSGAGGRVSYQKISEYMKIYYKNKKELKIKNIQNYINNSIKRLYLEKKTPDGKEIISTDSEGKAIIFYNPKIEI